MEEKIRLDKYVEDKIYRLNFVAKNFTREDMSIVDDYCKRVYDNNRKLMIFDLIRYKEENLPIILLNEKVDNIYAELLQEIITIKSQNKDKTENPEKVIKSWPGLGKK